MERGQIITLYVEGKNYTCLYQTPEIVNNKEVWDVSVPNIIYLIQGSEFIGRNNYELIYQDINDSKKSFIKILHKDNFIIYQKSFYEDESNIIKKLLESNKMLTIDGKIKPYYVFQKPVQDKLCFMINEDVVQLDYYQYKQDTTDNSCVYRAHSGAYYNEAFNAQDSSYEEYEFIKKYTPSKHNDIVFRKALFIEKKHDDYSIGIIESIELIYNKETKSYDTYYYDEEQTRWSEAYLLIK